MPYLVLAVQGSSNSNSNSNHRQGSRDWVLVQSATLLLPSHASTGTSVTLHDTASHPTPLAYHPPSRVSPAR